VSEKEVDVHTSGKKSVTPESGVKAFSGTNVDAKSRAAHRSEGGRAKHRFLDKVHAPKLHLHAPAIHLPHFHANPHNTLMTKTSAALQKKQEVEHTGHKSESEYSGSEYYSDEEAEQKQVAPQAF
jgi:hypothetical protein